MTEPQLRRPELPQLSAEDLSRIAALYGVAPDAMTLLKRADNLVYEGTGAGSTFIIRISHAQRRLPAQVQAEAAWLLRLAGRDVAVARPCRSLEGRLVEELRAGGAVLVVAAFEKVPGRSPDSGWAALDPWYEAWGGCVGRLHAAASQEHAEYARPHWNEDPALDLARLVPDQPGVIRRAEDLSSRLRDWPTDAHCYGLIHGDMHQGNTHLHHGRIYLYDFDDMQYGFFANDLAVLLYCARWYCPQGRSMRDYLWQITTAFLRGYRGEMAIDGVWLARLPELLELRRLLMYGNHYRNWDFDAVGREQLANLERHRREIEENVPMLAIDCDAL